MQHRHNDQISSMKSDPLLVCKEACVSEVVPDIAGRIAGKAALKHSETFDEETKLGNGASTAYQPCEIRWKNLKIGRFMGEGAFSQVQEATVRECSCCSGHTSSACLRIQGRKYAIKHLNESKMARLQTFEEGAVDLANEYKLLSHRALQHENIIRLFGVSQGCPSISYLGANRYFLVLDLLDHTLDHVLKRLRAEERLYGMVGKSWLSRRLSSRKGLTQEQEKRLSFRLQDVAIPVAKAMQHLHKHRIIYRDLKPANCGFDAAEGTLKLFDFGLAREIVDSSRRLTANTGTTRYMAPENKRGDQYGLPADVHSFGVFLWEVVTLKTPFQGVSMDDFHRVVVDGNFRPKVDSKCGSKELQTLIQQCWGPLPEQRPTFSQILQVLESELEKP